MLLFAGVQILKTSEYLFSKGGHPLTEPALQSGVLQRGLRCQSLHLLPVLTSQHSDLRTVGKFPSVVLYLSQMTREILVRHLPSLTVNSKLIQLIGQQSLHLRSVLINLGRILVNQLQDVFLAGPETQWSLVHVL